MSPGAAPWPEEELEETACIVGQIIEPIIRAGRRRAGGAGRPGVLTRRASRPLPCAGDRAWPRTREDPRVRVIAATPGCGSDCMFGYLGEVFPPGPLNPVRKCTTLSVAYAV